jgi:hypothetical protein
MLAILAKIIIKTFLVSNKACRQNFRKKYLFARKILNCFAKMDLIDHCGGVKAEIFWFLSYFLVTLVLNTRGSFAHLV